MKTVVKQLFKLSKSEKRFAASQVHTGTGTHCQSQWHCGHGCKPGRPGVGPHGVSLPSPEPELKKSTNLKMHLKPSPVYTEMYCQMPVSHHHDLAVHCSWYTL